MSKAQAVSGQFAHDTIPLTASGASGMGDETLRRPRWASVYKVADPGRLNWKSVLSDLRSRDANLPGQLRQLMRTTIFEETNIVRCGLSRTVFACVGAPELDSFMQRMPLSLPHGVTTNEGDDHVFGECPPANLVINYVPYELGQPSGGGSCCD
jgi:hypothetical protein